MTKEVRRYAAKNQGYREERDMTQRQVAAYLRCDRSLYAKYEREEREPPLHIMAQLAAFYKPASII